jgi:hypothetical protein
VPEGRKNGVLAADGPLDRSVIKDVSAYDPEALVLELEPGRLPGERSHLVAAFEGLGDELAARAAGGADDEKSQGISLSLQVEQILLSW